MDKRYVCTESFEVSYQDDNGVDDEQLLLIRKDTIWHLMDSPPLNDAEIHLSRDNGDWLGISNDRLEANFRLLI